MKYGKVWGKTSRITFNMMANGNGNEIEDFDKTIIDLLETLLCRESDST